MRDVPRFSDVFDVGAALILALVGAVAVAVVPDGSPLRLLLVAPILLFSPGYLLLQALVVPKGPASTRLLHAVLSIGISLPLVGLVALSTAVVRGGFRPVVIVILVALSCIGLAVLAVYRRLYHAIGAENPFVHPRPRFRRGGFVQVPRKTGPAPRPIPVRRQGDDMPVVTASIADPASERTSATKPGPFTRRDPRYPS